MPDRSHELVDSLVAVAAHFTAPAREEKRRLLKLLEASTIDDARTLGTLHETLCFLEAYPDDARTLSDVTDALEAIPDRVKRLSHVAARQLHDSGIAGTFVSYPFGLPMARWLARRSPNDVEIVWADFTDEERLQESLAILLHPMEQDAWSDEGGLGWRRWLDLAKAGRKVTDLQILLEIFDRATLDETARDWLFESLGLDIGWQLHGGPGGSRTFARLQWPRPFFHRDGRAPAIQRPNRERFLQEVIRLPASLRPASQLLAQRLIEAARLAMATRQRELFAFTHANPEDVLVADPGHGLRIVLIGILPKFRLAYEGYYAYFALKNGVPVGYGGGWQLFGTLEVGVNVFESFRRGESAFIVSQVFRAYHQALGMQTVLVDPYQIGHENPEALRSGAFYFYHHLGFRPRDPAVRALADAEEAKITKDASYRTSLPMLKRLARSEVYLTLSPCELDAESRLSASALAALVTDHVSRRFDGDRQAAARAGTEVVRRALGVSTARWTSDERTALERLSLVVALIPDLRRWPPSDRRRLVDVMRAKGGPSEARYVRLLDGHRRLRESLASLVRASK